MRFGTALAQGERASMSAVHGVHTDVDNTTPGAEKIESADLKEILAKLNGEKTEFDRASQNFGKRIETTPWPRRSGWSRSASSNSLGQRMLKRL